MLCETCERSAVIGGEGRVLDGRYARIGRD